MKRKLRCPLIVEGRYDKGRLASLVEGDIFTTEGFGVFRDKSRLEMIRRLAEADGVIVLTDSDRAGFRIRSAIASAVPPERITNAYIPELPGKEPRKAKPSAEGTLGVEGVPDEVLLAVLEQAGAFGEAAVPPQSITKQTLYELGLSGRENSAQLRAVLKARLGLPKGLSAPALPAVLSRLTDPRALAELVAALQTEANAGRKEEQK